MLADAVGKVDREATEALDDLEHVNITAAGSDDGLEGKSDHVDRNVFDVVCALVGSVCAQRAAVSLAGRAMLPADWTVTVIAVSARRIAQETAHLKSFSADKGFTSASAVGALGA